MQHLAELSGDQLINLCNARIDVGRQVVGDNHSAIEHFLDQLTNDVFRTRVLAVGLGNLTAGHDIVQQADALEHSTGLGLQLCTHHITPVQAAKLRHSIA